MPTRKLGHRQPDETDEHYAARLERRAALRRQVHDEIRYAAAGRGLSLREVARRMGDPTGRAVSVRESQPVSMERLADIGTAMGVTFRLIGVPDEHMAEPPSGQKPRSDRMFTPDQVREIRRRVKAGETIVEVAKDLGVGRSSIGQIARGDHYADVPFE
jgi:transcriptional regulator with XRE-family HTH domain